MTARMLLPLSLAVGLGGFAGCSGTKEVTDTDVGDDDDDTDIGDTDIDDDTVDTVDTGDDDDFPGTLAVAYQYGYNQQTRTTSPVVLDAGTGNPITIDPSIDVHLGTSTWNGDTSQLTEYCTISLLLNQATLDATFVGSDPRHIVGLLYNTADPALTDCFDGADPDLDASYFGTDFATYMAGYGEFGAAIGAVDPYTEGVIAPILTATLLPTDLVGGTLRDGFFLGGDIPEVYGFAWQVDPAFNVALDPNLYLQPVPFAQVDLGNNAASAWYDMNLLFYYVFN